MFYVMTIRVIFTVRPLPSIP